MQKHERKVFKAVRDVADDFGVSSVIERSNNEAHPNQITLTYREAITSIGIPSSPKDETWTVKLAKSLAKQTCRKMLTGEEVARYQHL